MLPRMLRWSPGLLVVPLWLFGSGARADLIDPAESVCAEAGEPCTLDGRAGACVKQTCSRLDYSNMGPGNVPGTRQYECVRCEIGAEVKPPTVPTVAEPAPAPTEDDAAAPTSPAEPKAAEPEKTSKGTRCAVGPSTSVVSIMLGLGLLGLAVRRRA